MPTQTVIIPEINLTITRWYGHITLDDMVQSHRDYMSDPAYLVGRPHLYDVSDVALPEINPDGLTKYISLVDRQDFGPDGVDVTVFAPTDILYGLARQYQSIVQSRSPINVQVFRDEAEALANVGQSGQRIKSLLSGQIDR